MKRKNELRAMDVMSTEMVSIESEATIREAAALLVDHGISGAPVRDEYGRIVGMLSLRDIARFERERDEDFEEINTKRSMPWGYHLESQASTKISDYMTPIIIAVPEDAPVEDVVSAMVERRIHRVLVRDAEGKICGIISALDILMCAFEGQWKR